MMEELLAIERQTVHREMTAEMFYASETRESASGRARVVSGRDGLGTLPASLESLNECLLFNSDVNPYVEYALVDNLMDGEDDGGRGGEDGEDEGTREGGEYEDDWKNLAEAPKSMQNALYDSMRATQFGFRPTMGAMPSLDLPTSLPSLRYAADISWSGATKAAAPIAPSSTATRLPDVVVTPSVLAPPPPLPPTPPPPPPLPRENLHACVGAAGAAPTGRERRRRRAERAHGRDSQQGQQIEVAQTWVRGAERGRRTAATARRADGARLTRRAHGRDSRETDAEVVESPRVERRRSARRRRRPRRRDKCP